ncbi:DUF1963 domain-containing protein [Pyxidicoccus sp. 3LFB2]
MSLQDLVEEFAVHVAAQTDAMARNMPGTGNRHARQYAAALEKLRAHGDAGMDALAVLLTHPRQDVVAMAATCLLQQGSHEANARRILEDMASGEGMLAFGASMTLKRWAEGTRDPAHEAAERPAPTGGEPTGPDLPQTQEPWRPRHLPGQPLELPDTLAAYRAVLERSLAPCVLFDKVAGPTGPRGCRYGGLPFLPIGTQWPRSPEGPLHFVGQLDFAELSGCRRDSLPELPKDGVLAFFYDVENQPWGSKPEDRAFWQLVYVPAGAEVVPVSPPQELTQAERSVLPECRIIPSMGLSMPGWSDLRAPVEPGFWSEEQGEALIELRRMLAGTATADQGADQVRGHANWWQEDGRVDAQLAAHGHDAFSPELGPEQERLSAGATEWSLLWQVGTDEALGFVWGGYGTLYLLIREEDLRACRFERSWLILQCS